MFINVFRDKCSSDRSEKSFVHTYMLRNSVCSGGYSVDTALAVEQMKAVREAYGVSEDERILYLRLTFLAYECKDFTVEFAEMIAQKVCEVFCREYQVVYGVHHYNDCWYLHIVLNPVNMYSGEILQLDKSMLDDVKGVVFHYSGVELVGIRDDHRPYSLR